MNGENDFCFEILDKISHNRNHFDCGVVELNDFILKYGFIELQDDPLSLIMPIKTLEKAIDKTTSLILFELNLDKSPSFQS